MSNHKTRLVYGTGAKECGPRCVCILCSRERKYMEKMIRQSGSKYIVEPTEDVFEIYDTYDDAKERQDKLNADND